MGFQVIAGPLVARRTITNAEIKTLPTTPVVVAPAPGAGKAYVHVATHLVCDATAGVYTNINAAAVGPFATYGSNVSATATMVNGDVDWILADNSAVNYALFSGKSIDGGALADVENQTLRLGMTNGLDGNLTGGHPANTLKVSTIYYIVEVA